MGEGSWEVGGATALRFYAPAAAAALDRLVRAWPASMSAQRFGVIRTVTAEGLGLTPLGGVPLGLTAGQGGGPEVVAMSFAEQFAVDVTRIEPELRTDWFRLTAHDVFDATLVVYVADWVPRLRAALDRLFGPDTWDEPTPRRVEGDQGRELMEEFLRQVALLRRVDEVTTELVRLRGARQHHCRLCMSRRSLPALAAGADARTFDDVDDYRRRDLPPGQQAALALVDGLIWTPAHLRPQDLDAVRAQLTPQQATEIVLDVARNASNKIAVALGADAPEVDGVQIFDVDDAGRMVLP